MFIEEALKLSGRFVGAKIRSLAQKNGRGVSVHLADKHFVPNRTVFRAALIKV